MRPVILGVSEFRHNVEAYWSSGMMYCPDCDASLDEVPVGEACPNCGGRRRAAIASPPPVAVVAVVEEVSYKITRSDHRPWEEKWRLVLHLRQQLAEAYAGNVPKGGNVEIDTHVTFAGLAPPRSMRWTPR